jgi:hypothetical protein
MKMNGKDMKDRRERERSRYRRGMGAQAVLGTSKRMAEAAGSSCLRVPKGISLWNIKNAGDEPQIDILMYIAGKGNRFADAGFPTFECTYYVHKAIGPDNRWYVCPKEWSKGRLPCPICEYQEKLKDDPQASPDVIKSFYPSRRQLFNVVDVKNRDKGVQVWDFSYHCFGELLQTYLEKRPEKLKNFCEYEGGMTLTLGPKKEKAKGFEFIDVKMIEFDERRKDYDGTEMIQKVRCLEDLVKVLPYDELKKVFMQTGEETAETKHRFKESDVDKIKDMNDKELAKFIIINDIDIDTDDFPETEDLQAAVIEKVEEAIAEDDPKSGKKDKDEEAKDTPADIEEGSEVTWDDDGDEKTGTVKSIKGKKAVIEDEDGDEHKVALDDLKLAEGSEKEEEKDEPEIEVGSDVKWTDDDQDEHEGTVKKIKKGVATVKEGKKEYEVEVGDLELTD